MPDWVEPGWRWFIEWTDKGEGVLRRIERIYLFRRSPYQVIEVLELSGIGKALVIDGKVQSSIYDEYWYHEALVHPVMLSVDCPRKVLIIGGGEGATLREVLKHRCVEKAVMVDLDSEVIAIAKEYLHEWHQGSFNNPKAEVVISDGKKFLEETRDNYDVIIIDLVDPTVNSPAAALYTKEFYELAKSRMSSESILVTQATSPILTPKVFLSIVRNLEAVFRRVTPYITYVRSFNSLWGFVSASDKYSPKDLNPSDVDKLLADRLGDKAKSLRFYNGETHAWLFTMPKPLKDLLEEG
ncbi:MAG: fused MFS/spermidine synthase [Pyrodictiaceae archaeon]